jgi:hypothetical protein
MWLIAGRSGRKIHTMHSEELAKLLTTPGLVREIERAVNAREALDNKYGSSYDYSELRRWIRLLEAELVARQLTLLQD